MNCETTKSKIILYLKKQEFPIMVGIFLYTCKILKRGCIKSEKDSTFIQGQAKKGLEKFKYTESRKPLYFIH